MSKTIHSQQKKQLKASIDDFVGPILKQLEDSKNHEDSSHLRGDIEEICMLVKETKSVLENRKKWDNKLIGHFERMQRQIDYDNENKGEGDREKRKDHKWVWAKEKLKSLLKKQVVNARMDSSESDNEASYFPQGNATHDDDSLIQFEEYISQLNQQHRDCLYSLGTFPENAKLKKRLLLYWWIGLGLSLEEKTPEQAAETFFCDLVEKKILQPIHTRRHNQVVDCCIINPTIHLKLISDCKSKRLLIDINSNEGTLRLYSAENYKTRALLNLNDQYLNSEDIAKNILVDITMQALQFGNWHCMTKLEIGNMAEGNVSKGTNFKDHIEVDKTDFMEKLGKKVAFLSLRSISGIEELPYSIGKLDDLRILDLRACHNLENLPRKPRSKSRKILGLVSRQQKWFKNLTHLDISDCFLLHYTPKWICELFNIEVLKGFVASNEVKKKIYVG